MVDFITSLISNFQHNSFLQTFVSITGAGAFTFFMRDVILKGFNLIKGEFITECALTSSHRTYHNLLEYIQKTNKNVSFRKLKASNGRYGGSDTVILSIGYGNHIIKYQGKYLFISLSKEGSNYSEWDKETITITTLGRSRKIFEDLLIDVEKCNTDNTKIKLFQYLSDWMFIRDLHKRNLDTIFIEEQNKEKLTNTLKEFTESEDYYLSNGIPYQLGLMLYGPPGTGKSSLIKALASYIDYPIYYLPTSSLSSIPKAVRSLPSKCLLVIEDIDTNSLTKNRTVKKKLESDNSTPNNVFEELEVFSLSEVLNSLDGLIAPHGRILIVTTNHIEKLDPALIRPGRIDHKIEVGYLTKEPLEKFLTKFYNTDVSLSDVEIKSNLTIAELQRMVLEGRSLNSVLDYCKVDDQIMKLENLLKNN